MRRRTFVTAGLTAAAGLAVLPMIPAGADSTTVTLQVLVYSGGAYPARPAGLAAGGARYIGPTQPGSWLVGDEWVQPSS